MPLCLWEGKGEGGTMEKPAVRGYRRKNYFIDKRFQTNFILRFSLLVFIGGLLTMLIFYLLSLQSTTVGFIGSRVVARSTADFILPILLQTVILVTIIIGLASVVMTLLVSHKIAGPLFRFKKVMESLQNGDFASVQEVRLRKRDQLQLFASELNSMIKNTKNELNQFKKDFASLKEKLDAIQDSDIPEFRRALFVELKKISEEVKNKINYFKT